MEGVVIATYHLELAPTFLALTTRVSTNLQPTLHLHTQFDNRTTTHTPILGIISTLKYFDGASY